MSTDGRGLVTELRHLDNNGHADELDQAMLVKKFFEAFARQGIAMTPEYFEETKTDQLQREVAKLRKEVKSLRQIVQPHVVIIREVDESTAEKDIVGYLEKHGHADTGELVEKLGIDIDMVLKVVQHLKEQNKVESHDPHQPS